MASNSKNKILICTPSNKALDEIVTRLSVNGFISKEKGGVDLTEKLIRVHSSGYKTYGQIKKHFLDFRIYCKVHKYTK